MTELALSSPREKRLFQTVDMVPLPQHRVLLDSLNSWRNSRGARLAPYVDEAFTGQSASVLDNSLMAEPLSGSRDFALDRIGGGALSVLGGAEPLDRLSHAGNVRLAARLRLLFKLTAKQGEPLNVRFVDGRRSFEVLAAPVIRKDGMSAVFCTLSYDELLA